MTEQERALITDLIGRITQADAPAPPGANPWSAPPSAAADPGADPGGWDTSGGDTLV